MRDVLENKAFSPSTSVIRKTCKVARGSTTVQNGFRISAVTGKTSNISILPTMSHKVDFIATDYNKNRTVVQRLPTAAHLCLSILSPAIFLPLSPSRNLKINCFQHSILYPVFEKTDIVSNLVKYLPEKAFNQIT